MSLSELLVIFIVAFLLIKPEDLPKIIKKIKEFYSFFNKTKQEFIAYFDPPLQKSDKSIDDNIEEINFYLEKIAKLGGEYEGQYSLGQIKKRYHALVKESMQEEK